MLRRSSGFFLLSTSYPKPLSYPGQVLEGVARRAKEKEEEEEETSRVERATTRLMLDAYLLQDVESRKNPLDRLSIKQDVEGCPFCGEQPEAHNVVTADGQMLFRVGWQNPACHFHCYTMYVDSLPEALKLWGTRRLQAGLPSRVRLLPS